jgi:hypothetical protein
MYEKIVEDVSSELDEIFQLDEARTDPTRNLFGLNFEDYDHWLELGHDELYDKAKPDQKWMQEIGAKVNTIKKNKKEWKKFEAAYSRGNWQDYVYSVKVDDEGNWSSTKEKLKGEALRKKKVQNKSVAKFMKGQKKQREEDLKNM